MKRRRKTSICSTECENPCFILQGFQISFSELSRNTCSLGSEESLVPESQVEIKERTRQPKPIKMGERILPASLSRQNQTVQRTTEICQSIARESKSSAGNFPYTSLRAFCLIIQHYRQAFGSNLIKDLIKFKDAQKDPTSVDVFVLLQAMWAMAKSYQGPGKAFPDFENWLAGFMENI